jgi:TRAP-type C4-dicarboxylate transport system permease small subunit
MGKLLTEIENVFVFLAIGSSFLLVCLTTADAGGRYLLNWPISGAYELSETYLMPILFYFAICYGYRKGVNIRVTFMVRHLPPRVKLGVNYFVQVVSILYGVCLFIAGGVYTYQRFGEILILPEFNVPLWPAFAVVPVGVFFMTLRMGMDLWQVKSGKSGLFIEDEETSVT